MREGFTMEAVDWSGRDDGAGLGRREWGKGGLDGIDLPATQMNFFALFATSFSWYRHAPPPLMQFRSSSISSAPSNATSRSVPSGKLSKAIGVRSALMITWRDW